MDYSRGQTYRTNNIEYFVSWNLFRMYYAWKDMVENLEIEWLILGF